MNLQLTPEEQTKVDQWNRLGEKLTDNTMAKFLPSWFANMRSLIQANFKLHGVGELAERLRAQSDDLIVLGSGPSVQDRKSVV
jgi:hypothetical protein